MSLKDGEVIGGEFVSADRIWSEEDIDHLDGEIVAMKTMSDDDLLREIVKHAKAGIRHNFLGQRATEELDRRGGITASLKELAVKKGVI